MSNGKPGKVAAATTRSHQRPKPGNPNYGKWNQYSGQGKEFFHARETKPARVGPSDYFSGPPSVSRSVSRKGTESSHKGTPPKAIRGTHSHKGKRGGSLSGVARDYVKALAEPLDAPLTGIPTIWPLAQSYKFKTWIKGSLIIGTAGYGFLQWAPSRLAANDYPAVYSSGSAYALSSLPVTYLEAGVTSATSNSPFASTSFAASVDGLQSRVVGCCGKVWYTGKDVNLGGEMFGLRQPDNEGLTGGLTSADLLAFPTTVRAKVTSKRETMSVLYVPTRSTQTDYSVPANTDPMCAAIFITGTPDETYGFEVAVMLEVIGREAPSVTPTHGDPEGFTAVVETAEDASSSFVGSVRNVTTTMISAAASEVSRMSHAAASGAGKAAAGVASTMLAGAIAAWRMNRNRPGHRFIEMVHEPNAPPVSMTRAEFKDSIATRKYVYVRLEPPVVRRKGTDFSVTYDSAELSNLRVTLRALQSSAAVVASSSSEADD